MMCFSQLQVSEYKNWFSEVLETCVTTLATKTMQEYGILTNIHQNLDT